VRLSEAEAVCCSWFFSCSRRKSRFWLIERCSRIPRVSFSHFFWYAACPSRISSATTWKVIDVRVRVRVFGLGLGLGLGLR